MSEEIKQWADDNPYETVSEELPEKIKEDCREILRFMDQNCWSEINVPLGRSDYLFHIDMRKKNYKEGEFDITIRCNSQREHDDIEKALGCFFTADTIHKIMSEITNLYGGYSGSIVDIGYSEAWDNAIDEALKIIHNHVDDQRTKRRLSKIFALYGKRERLSKNG